MLDFVQIKPHSRRKYSILRKYLDACEILSNKYRNFAYIDTHGGTGKVLDLETRKSADGSVLTAAKHQPSFPCHVAEIDRGHYETLRMATSGLRNVTLHFGDCNEKIGEMLRSVGGGRFIFCFLDPDALVTRIGTPQLKWTTIEKIARFPRTEILVNLQVFPIMRSAESSKGSSKRTASIKLRDNITALYGTDEWEKLGRGDFRGFLRLFISERLRGYKYKGAILIRQVRVRGPLYYLVYGSNSRTGAKIMRGIMSNEWLSIVGTEPLTKIGKTKTEWLDFEYSLDKPFIFEH